jgi:hypothetical protein
MLKVGKIYLYSCLDYFLLLYPDKKAADFASLSIAAPYIAGYFSEKIGKPVYSCDPLEPLLVLKVERRYYQVLIGNKKGWIIKEPRIRFKEIL